MSDQESDSWNAHRRAVLDSIQRLEKSLEVDVRRLERSHETHNEKFDAVTTCVRDLKTELKVDREVSRRISKLVAAFYGATAGALPWLLVQIGEYLRKLKSP